MLTAASDWRIPRQAGEMARELALGHAEAAIRHETREGARIQAWAEARSRQAEDLRLAVRVPHRDVLCLPPG